MIYHINIDIALFRFKVVGSQGVPSVVDIYIYIYIDEVGVMMPMSTRASVLDKFSAPRAAHAVSFRVRPRPSKLTSVGLSLPVGNASNVSPRLFG